MIARLLVPAVALSLLVGCSAGSDPQAAAPTPAPTSAAPTATSAAPAPSRPPSGTVIEVTYQGGQVTGVEQRVPVKLGERVVIRVTSDVTEEIHVHGYDLYVDLAPGTPGEVAFEAELPGTWEVELHDAGRPLFQLRVA